MCNRHSSLHTNKSTDENTSRLQYQSKEMNAHNALYVYVGPLGLPGDMLVKDCGMR